jgi:hypothetical protein
MTFVLHQSYWEQCEYEVGIALGHTNIISSLVQGISAFFTKPSPNIMDLHTRILKRLNLFPSLKRFCGNDMKKFLCC